MHEFTTYRGYTLFWTGWKSFPGMIELVGQWVASPPNNEWPKYYSSTGGVDGKLECPGLVIDISQLYGVPWISIFSTEKDMNTIKKVTINRLKSLIDKELDNADLRIPV